MGVYNQYLNLQTANFWAFVALNVALAVFGLLILRAFFISFFKINKIIRLLEQIEKNTEKPKTIAMPTYTPKSPKPPDPFSTKARQNL